MAFMKQNVAEIERKKKNTLLGNRISGSQSCRFDLWCSHCCFSAF